MKRILLSMASVSLALGAFAQLPVSTTPQNKKVVLEEYTGMYCTFCPDGHKIAEQIRAANPNDVFLINVHTGSFATPSGSDPDFRTPFGSALAGQTGLTGYPSGTVNRHVFSGSSTALGRGSWASSATTILGQPAYANLALEADIDVASRTMTVDLEAYFTANGASSVNINVAVTQNNIAGPQTGGSSYNPSQVLPNGDYNHGHMLRHLITGQWGDVVTTTTSGTTVTKQYTWTIPADINGVPVEIGDLQVIAFLVEGQQEIVTGAEGPVSFTVPAGTVLVDLETTDQTATPSSFCAATVTPMVNITNNETADCSGYTVSYTLDGGTPVSETVSTPLAGGASIVHTFPAANINGGAHTIDFDISLTSSSELEVVTGNNTSSSSTFMTIDANPIGSIFEEDFESYNAMDGIWDNVAMNENADHFVMNENAFQNIPNALGGYGNSANSFRHRLYNMNAGVTNEIVTYKVDFSNAEHLKFMFDYACAGLNDNLTDKLEVFASTDCGANWTSLWSKSGADLVTGPSQTPNAFYPTPTQWASAELSLASYQNEGEVIFKFVVTGSGNGNTLYLDNISIGGWPVGVSELFSNDEMSLFPNPTAGESNLKIVSSEVATVDVRIYDVTGKTVNAMNTALNSGVNMIELEIADLPNGVYFVEVSSNEKVSTRKLVIRK